MQAAVLRETGAERLDVVDDAQVAEVGPGQVRVALRATGLCHSDLSYMRGMIAGPAPAVLGHEGAGEIVEIGPGVERLAVGDHVVLSFTPPCGHCRYCREGQANLCVDIVMVSNREPRFLVDGKPAFGMGGLGTFAQETVVPVEAVIPIDKDVPFDIASLIGCAVTTGVGAAINTAKVQPGSSVVVFGIGGVGVSVIQGARIAGAAEIVAVDPVESKHALALGFGATHAVVPQELTEAGAAATGGRGFDYAFEAVGSAITIRAAYDAARRGGTVVVVGVGSPTAQVTFNAFELFSQEKRLLGSMYGSADVRTDFARFLRLWRAGRLDLEGMITQHLGLHQVNEGFDAMRDGTVIRSVITI